MGSPVYKTYLCIFSFCYMIHCVLQHVSEDEYSMNSRFCDNLVRIVKLKKHRLQYACAATLLNQTHVLTAAHCVISNSTYYVRYKSGNISVPTYDYNEVLVTDKWIHPNYNENILGCKGNDVAILKIKTSISHALPTILATSQFNYSTAFICKWNRKQTENATQLSNPEFIPVTVHDTATCKRAEENVNETYMHDNICATGNNISLKEGDTGSPAYVFNNDGKIILIGFVYCGIHFSEAIFANSTYPVAITNISTFIDWIQYLSTDTTIAESSQDEYSMNSRFCDNLVGIVEEYVQNTTPLRYICAAILLNQTHVLTAAHCVISNSTYHVRYKSGNVSVSTYDYNEVTDKWIHPNYNENILGCKGNDVAILKIKTSISHALPTILATSQFNYSTAFICKWNRKQTENATQLSNPEFIPVTVHDTATCKQAEENVNETYMHDNICASGNNISLKEGDTGSPAYVFNNDGKIILIGFLYCEVQLSEAIFANSTYPVAITNISTFIAWIQYLSIDTTIIESSRNFEITFVVSILALIVIILIFVGLLMYLSNNEDYEQNPTPESIPLNKL